MIRSAPGVAALADVLRTVGGNDLMHFAQIDIALTPSIFSGSGPMGSFPPRYHQEWQCLDIVGRSPRGALGVSSSPSERYCFGSVEFFDVSTTTARPQFVAQLFEPLEQRPTDL